MNWQKKVSTHEKPCLNAPWLPIEGLWLTWFHLQLLGLLDKVSWKDYSVLTRDKQNIIARVYRSRSASSSAVLPVYLYFHGGGHLLGTIETEDAACSRIAWRAGIIVVNVGYRHTPEFKHPTQVNDAWDSFEWLLSSAAIIGADLSRIIVGGISAGAGLAAFVATQHHALSMRKEAVGEKVNICGQLLCVPWLIHPENYPFNLEANSSYVQNMTAPILPRSLLNLFTDLLQVKDPRDPSLNTALISNSKVVGLPKTSFLVAGQDLLRDEGLFYAEKLKRNGCVVMNVCYLDLQVTNLISWLRVPTKVHIFPGLPHAFRRYSNLCASKRWDQLLVESCEWLLSENKDSSMTIETEDQGSKM